jgi:hypothetical protein
VAIATWGERYMVGGDRIVQANRNMLDGRAGIKDLLFGSVDQPYW